MPSIHAGEWDATGREAINSSLSATPPAALDTDTSGHGWVPVRVGLVGCDRKVFPRDSEQGGLPHAPVCLTGSTA
jgi:hypothetical protein